MTASDAQMATYEDVLRLIQKVSNQYGDISRVGLRSLTQEIHARMAELSRPTPGGKA